MCPEVVASHLFVAVQALDESGIRLLRDGLCLGGPGFGAFQFLLAGL